MRGLRDQRGIAVPIALMVSLITTVLGSAAVLAATQTNSVTNHDTGSKAALEAAEAGLRTATYRLNMLGTQDAYCPTTPTATAWNATTRLCAQEGPTTLGNGGTYSYWVSAPLVTGNACAGETVQNSQYPVAQRCVTAIGTVNGVGARTQARVAAYAAQPLFGGAGLIGVNRLSIANNASIYSTVGSNGTLTLSNNVLVDGTTQSGVAALLGPAGKLTTSNNVVTLPAGNKSTSVPASQLSIAPVDPGCSSGGVGAAPAGNACFGTGWNLDDRIAGCTAAGSATVDKCSGLTWNASTRSVSLTNNASVTLAGGTLPYNFCNFTAQNNVTITIPIGAHVVIFIDSSSQDGGDPNGNCPKGSGVLTLGNNVQLINNNPDPTSLQIYVYGTSPKGANVVTWNNNSVNTAMTLYAPNSTIELQNNGTFTGGIGGYNVDVLNNIVFRWAGTEANLSAARRGSITAAPGSSARRS
jgi:Tfp pilus assembly protein PilX